jgi:hypothetical protein
MHYGKSFAPAEIVSEDGEHALPRKQSSQFDFGAVYGNHSSVENSQSVHAGRNHNDGQHANSAHPGFESIVAVRRPSNQQIQAMSDASAVSKNPAGKPTITRRTSFNSGQSIPPPMPSSPAVSTSNEGDVNMNSTEGPLQVNTSNVRRTSFRSKSPSPIVTSVNMPKEIKPERFSPRFEDTNPMNSKRRSSSNPSRSEYKANSRSSSLLDSISAAKQACTERSYQHPSASLIEQAPATTGEFSVHAAVPQTRSLLSAFTSPLASGTNDDVGDYRSRQMMSGGRSHDGIYDLNAFASIVDGPVGIKARLFLRQQESLLEKQALIKRLNSADVVNFELELRNGAHSDPRGATAAETKRMKFSGADIRYSRKGIGKKSLNLIQEDAELCMHLFIRGKGELNMALQSEMERDLAVLMFSNSIISRGEDADDSSVRDDVSVASSYLGPSAGTNTSPPTQSPFVHEAQHIFGKFQPSPAQRLVQPPVS